MEHSRPLLFQIRRIPGEEPLVCIASSSSPTLPPCDLWPGPSGPGAGSLTPTWETPAGTFFYDGFNRYLDISFWIQTFLNTSVSDPDSHGQMRIRTILEGLNQGCWSRRSRSFLVELELIFWSGSCSCYYSYSYLLYYKYVISKGP